MNERERPGEILEVEIRRPSSAEGAKAERSPVPVPAAAGEP